MDLEVRHLQALVAVAETGTFGKAAEALGYTQSAVSQQIAALERVAGTPMFDRPGGPRPVRLTTAGERSSSSTPTPCSPRCGVAATEVEEVARGERGRLRVGLMQSVGTKILPGILTRFTGERPAGGVRAPRGTRRQRPARDGRVATTSTSRSVPTLASRRPVHHASGARGPLRGAGTEHARVARPRPRLDRGDRRSPPRGEPQPVVPGPGAPRLRRPRAQLRVQLRRQHHDPELRGRRARDLAWPRCSRSTSTDPTITILDVEPAGPAAGAHRVVARRRAAHRPSSRRSSTPPSRCARRSPPSGPPSARPDDRQVASTTHARPRLHRRHRRAAGHLREGVPRAPGVRGAVPGRRPARRHHVGDVLRAPRRGAPAAGAGRHHLRLAHLGADGLPVLVHRRAVRRGPAHRDRDRDADPAARVDARREARARGAPRDQPADRGRAARALGSHGGDRPSTTSSRPRTGPSR